MKIAINKNKFVFLLLFSFSLLLLIFSLDSKVIACPSGCGSHTYCGCTGTGGCVYRSGSCLSTEVRVTCGAAGSMCCHKGICVDCEPCSGDYQSSNNGCSSATRSCTKNYCIGGSCGTRSATCYRVKYSVSVNGNGGTCSPASQSICGDTASGAVTCSRSGYTFGGFTITSGSCGGTFNSSTGVCSSVKQNITIQANWSIVSSYTVTVDANGGTCSPGTHTVTSGSSSSSQTCTKTGYTLSSFSITSGSCSSFNTSTGVCSSVTAPITIRANWSINSYYVSVNGNGGTCSPGSHYVNYGNASSAQTCTRTGHTFSSFSITSGSGSCGSFNTSTGVCSSVTGPVSIQANWSINSYYVSVNGNGGTCSPGSHYVNYGNASSAQTCTRTGYTFSSFTITSGTCSSFNTSTGVCSSVTAPITIRANWKINVTVNGNGGTCSPGSHSVTSGSASLAQTCTRTGYTFNNFSITSGSCSSFNTSTGVCSSVTAPITIRANWKINVTVNGNGGTCSPGSHSVTSGSSSLAQTCSRTGYTFNNFSITSGSCSSFNTSTGVCSSVTAPITIRANWKINVTVNGNGGTCSPGSHSVTSGSSSLAQTCSRTGHTFSSFTITSGSCSSFNTSTGVCSSVTAPITIRANWSINSYYVSVVGNGGTCSPGSHYVNHGSASSSQTCTKTGYTFSSFSITSGSCGGTGTFNTSTGVCSSVTQAITITANWKINSYYVSVNGNGGTCSPGSHYVDYGNPSSSQTCSRTGYTFSGFTITSGSCGGSFTSSTGVCSKVTGSIAIRANWQCIPISCNCSPLSSSSTSYGSKTVTCSDGCGGTTSRECWCTNNCTPQSCPSETSESGTHGTYATYSCTNECNKSNSRTCKCTSACTPTSCPTGTTETNTGDSYSSYSCTNMCNESQTRNCYCSICTPPSCLSRGYSDTNLGYGQVPLEKTPSCRNGYNAPNYISKCDMTYRTCYCPSCLKQCPSPLANTGSANLILNDFRECTNDCDVKPPEDQDDCYEVPSEQPAESLAIDGKEADPNEFGFLSLTHTGDNKNIPKQGDLNDPLSPIKMVATYTDTDGADDIEGMFVWFRGEQYTGELGTPIFLSETAEPKASSDDSWGFMLRKNGTSNWDPYVPSYQEVQPSWTKAIYTTLLGYRVFYISGPNSKQMVEVTILEQPLKEGDKVIMEFSLRFSNSEGILYNDPVAEGKYNIYLMGLDKFSFTPYDNYDIDYQGFWSEGFKYNGEENLSPFWQDNQLRYKQGLQAYAKDWSYTGQTWTIDRKGPYIEAFAFGTPNDNKLEVHWNVRDDRNLYAVVGNIYTTGGAFSRPIELLSNDPDNEIALLDPGRVLTFHNPNPFIPSSAAEADDIGKINGDWAFKVGPDPLSLSSSHSIYIDVGENTTGLFDIHLTVFDDAGNFSTSKISINIADWFATAGGLAYSAEGTYFSTKDFVTIAERPPLPYPSQNPGLQFGNSDYSSELWAEKNNENPVPLVRSNETKSYNITRYLGYKSTGGYYDYLKKEYMMNKQNVVDMGLEEVFPESSTLSGSLNGICNNESYCMFEYTGNLNVKGDVICDNRSLIFVGGDLTIETPLKNTNDNQLSNKNGCIFVVKGDVTVQKGKNMSSTSLGYDIIHGYLLTDGQIIVEDETDKRLLPNTDPIIDGVYINGGLSSSYREGTGIIMNRYLRVEEKLTYPVLVIDYHPKYGVIAEKFFGRKSTVKAVEIGVKP